MEGVHRINFSSALCSIFSFRINKESKLKGPRSRRFSFSSLGHLVFGASLLVVVGVERAVRDVIYINIQNKTEIKKTLFIKFFIPGKRKNAIGQGPIFPFGPAAVVHSKVYAEHVHKRKENL